MNEQQALVLLLLGKSFIEVDERRDEKKRLLLKPIFASISGSFYQKHERNGLIRWMMMRYRIKCTGGAHQILV